MNSADVNSRETLFWEFAQQLLAEPDVTQGTMIGVPLPAFERCLLRLHRTSNRAPIVKLPGQRVKELVATGQALPFAPNGRTFREWAAFPVADPGEWRALLAEARGFAGG